jgi:hypothetical protein
LLIRAVVREGNHQVGDGDLEGHAHASAEVESEIQLALLGVPVGLADDRDDGGVSLGPQEVLGFLGRGGIKLGVGDFAGVEQLFRLIDSLHLSLILELAREVVEAERVQGRQCEQHRKDQDGTLVLHGSGVFKGPQR